MRRGGGNSWRGRMQGRGGDDTPPRGEEARSQRRATSMPWVWLAAGLLVVAVFVAFLMLRFGHQPPGATSLSAPQASGAAPRPVTH